MKDSNKLEIKDLTVELGEKCILDKVGLDVADGEFMVLVGPSGCGKSTLLKTIAGINPVSGGSMYLDGRLMNDTPPHKRGTVIVFQDMRLFPNMSAAENVAYPLRIRGMKKAERLKKADEFLGYVKLGGFGDRRVNSLSGGQMQRVALARALAAEPSLVLLDEPFSSLDENLRGDMRSLVKELHDSFGMTTVMVTHDRQEALDMADRLAVMIEGEIVRTGSPEEVLRDPADSRVAEYFGL